MENTSYALHIAVGVLIGIAILSLLLFRWRQIGGMESAKEEADVIKNRAEFNAEYEAYNRGLMYGTDVLSCLNKAQNNNQKYVYNNYYGTDAQTLGKDDREEYFMDVQVTLNSTLCDDIKAYYKDKTGKYKRVIGLSAGAASNYNDKVFSTGTGNHFDDPTIYYYYFKKGNVYKEESTYTQVMWGPAEKGKTLYQILNTGKIETNVTADTYNLLTNEDTSSASSIDETAKLAALITTVNLKSQTLFNKVQPSVFDKNDWWYCAWTTAANDFKSRKFRCTGVEFDENNGYIEKISFVEIN